MFDYNSRFFFREILSSNLFLSCCIFNCSQRSNRRSFDDFEILSHGVFNDACIRAQGERFYSYKPSNKRGFQHPRNINRVQGHDFDSTAVAESRI